jgi:hypothetical protein
MGGYSGVWGAQRLDIFHSPNVCPTKEIYSIVIVCLFVKILVEGKPSFMM